jgi:hypothetical protein
MDADPQDLLAKLAGKKHGIPLGPVPVFNCVVIVTPRAADGKVRARVANLPDIAVAGASEREVLQGIVAQFKQVVGQLHAAGQSIPWQDPPLKPEPHEQQRLIAVHL